jgi:hypothetical protein
MLGRSQVAGFLIMAELSQKEQLALHEFSARYREALAKQHQTPEQSLDIVRDAVREQYEQEMGAKRSPSIEPSTPEKEREPEEPDQGH